MLPEETIRQLFNEYAGEDKLIEKIKEEEPKKKTFFWGKKIETTIDPSKNIYSGIDHRKYNLDLNAIFRLKADLDENGNIDYKEFRSYFIAYDKAQELGSKLMKGVKRVFLNNDTKSDFFRIIGEQNPIKVNLVFNECDTKTVDELLKDTKYKDSKDIIAKCFDLADVYRDCRHPHLRLYDPTSTDHNLNYGEFCDFLCLLIISEKMCKKK